MKHVNVIFWILFICCIGVLFVMLTTTIFSVVNLDKSYEESWVIRLLINLLCYSTVAIPGFLIHHYLEKIRYQDQPENSGLSFLIKLCFFGSSETLLESGTAVQKETPLRSPTKQAQLLMVCFMGLQGSYLTWGILQEKIMTLDYVTASGETERFKDSQFLVFVNRILAFAISLSYIIATFRSQPKHTAPLYKYGYCSFSNIMSSWCQYEALKFISFPTQVLAKASKLIPVMIMGKILSKKTYEYYEYVTAVLISVGMMLFLFGSEETHKNESVTTISGIIILTGYMVFDSFTSNWQEKLSKQHRMSSIQMMCGVNLFSILFTSVSILQQGSMIAVLGFMSRHPKFIFDCVILSVCSATGQLFIFYTIAQFGAIVFTIMMTVRQAVAVLLSCIIYGHSITLLGVLGINLVFFAVFLKTYCSYRVSMLRKYDKYQVLGSFSSGPQKA